MPTQLTPFLYCIAFGCGGIVVIALIMPFLARMGLVLEVINIMSGAIAEYYQRPGLAKPCCLVLLMGMFGCCVAVALLIIGFAGCYTGNTSAICRLLGR